MRSGDFIEYLAGHFTEMPDHYQHFFRRYLSDYFISFGINDTDNSTSTIIIDSKAEVAMRLFQVSV